MNLLLDTHAFIWFSENDPLLSRAALKAIETPENVKYISIASLWEMAIKHSLGKLQLKKALSGIIAEIQVNGFDLFPVSTAHILQVETLPFHHKDPFDRMLIGQAISEDFTIVSKEDLFDQYSVRRLW